MKKFFKILFFIILLSIFILWLVKIFLLTHKYQVKYYNEDKIEKDIVITFNGIYGTEKQLRFIDEKLAEEGYSVVNIQYPTVDDKIAEMTDKYIVPIIDDQVKKLNEIIYQRQTEIVHKYYDDLAEKYKINDILNKEYPQEVTNTEEAKTEEKK